MHGTIPIEMERAEARTLYEQYRQAPHFGGEIDREIARSYRLLSQGKLIIRALESVRAAGVDEDGRPKLAIMRADQRTCLLRMWGNGSADFRPGKYTRAGDTTFDFPAGSFEPPKIERLRQATAIVPLVPAHLRPRKGGSNLANYHILWEADWRDVPADPLLLRRLGKGDLWLVVAAWDLTEVERAALRARV